MAVNYAEKYSSKIDERFRLGTMTNPAINNDYEFVGVQTVKVFSVPTAAMNDYTRTGSARYGTPAELENTVQEMTLSQDRSFTFTIDRASYDDTMMTLDAGRALQRQIDEVIIPELDVYRLSKICAGAGTTSEAAAITTDNAYSAFLAGTEALTEGKAPQNGRVAFVTANYFSLIKQDNMFIKQSDTGQSVAFNGQVGMVDGVPLIVVPSSYLPENTAFVITNPIATCAPVKLTDYKIHDNPPGINGWLVEGRVRYDAFVLDNKAGAIYVHRTAEPTLGTLTVDSTAGTEVGQTKITVMPKPAVGNKLVYKTAASTAPSVTYDADLSGWTEITDGAEIAATTGHKITVAETTAEFKARKSGNTTVTSKA